MTEITKLLAFIEQSPNACAAVVNVCNIAQEAGFTEIDNDFDLDCKTLVKFFVRIKDTGVFLFHFPEPTEKPSHIHFIGAHTDSPHLKIKPNGYKHNSYGTTQLYIEPYGGVLLHTWFDRDLHLSGRVYYRDNNQLCFKSIFTQKPVCHIPSLAIHLNRQVNEELKIDKSTELTPVFGSLKTSQTLQEFLSQETSIPENEILSYDLSLSDASKPVIGGSDNSLIHSARLDNLAMCHAALEALCFSQNGPAIKAVLLYDNEEIGSETENGAASVITEHILEQIFISKGYSRNDLLSTLKNSVFFSADMAHARHPNYTGKSDDANFPLINEGITIKTNQARRYATTGKGEAFFASVCKETGLSLQYYTHRNDMPCGSTIGPIMATKLGVSVFDAGNPMWAMHSIRETAGAFDHASMIRAMQAFLSTELRV